MSDNQTKASCPRKESITSLMSVEDGEDAERRHIEKVIGAFRCYRKYAFIRINKTEAYLDSLPKSDRKMLTKYRNHLDTIRSCIRTNQSVIEEMLKRENVLYPTVGSVNEATIKQLKNDRNAINVMHEDMEHLQSILKLIARDWSAEGALEREQSYKPIIDAIEEFYNPELFVVNEVKILVPGAGLGRLTYELASRGYECEGNEFSCFMLIASNFVLNQCKEENSYLLFPWVHQYVNNVHRSDHVTGVRFPDICPLKNPPKGNLMVAAGDFLEAYKTTNAFDCVATCFFIDCANNIIDFIRTIYRILVPGGIWVNLGPLLYHYSDVRGEHSIEPTFEDLIIIMETIGFDIVRSKSGVRTKYAQNPLSMQKSEYESLFWICRKPIKEKENSSSHGDSEDDDDDNDANYVNNDTAVVDGRSKDADINNEPARNGMEMKWL